MSGRTAPAAAAALAAAVVLAPAGAAGAAPVPEIARCDMALGPKLAIDERYEDFRAVLTDCPIDRVQTAWWTMTKAVDPTSSKSIYFDNVDEAIIEWGPRAPLGAYNITPLSAADDADPPRPVPQNTLQVVVKQQTKATLDASRSGRTVTLTATVKHFDVGPVKYVSHKGARVHFQVQTPQGWKTMARINANSNGKATHRQTAGNGTTWRAIVLETTNSWDRTTTTRTI